MFSKLLLLFANLSFLSSFGDATLGSNSDIVDTGYARYLGNRTFPTTVAYLGIPYAEPPLGERRFRAPLPLNTTRIMQSTHGAVVDATEYPDFCVQGTTGGGDAGGAGSEDCLKVNIYAPAGAKLGSNLPVLVYIHGSVQVYELSDILPNLSFQWRLCFGNPRNWPFDHWIRQSPNVVIVSVYYRLDSFGFLATPEFKDSAYGDLNAGFLDQVQALKWVKQTIGFFGGDPSKVTINGQSAGGSSVELHLVAHEGEKLFSGAIAQSVYRTPLPTPEQQELLFQFYAINAGCGAGTVVEQLDCLRNASISALARAQDAAGSSAFTGAYKLFHPVLDGKLFTDYPTRSIVDSQQFARVPLIVGSTSNETLSGGSDIAAALTQFFPMLSAGDTDEYLQAYPSSEFSSSAQRLEVATGESELICARAALGGAFAKSSKAWTYRYNQRNPTSGGTGVEHAAENWMMFLGTNTGFNGTTTFTPMTPVEIAFAEELIAYWLSFVRSGDPNTFRLAWSPQWSAYTADDKNRIVLQQDPLNTTTHSGSFVEQEPLEESERCAFVVSKVEHEQN